MLDLAGSLKVGSTIFAGNKSVYNFSSTNTDSGYNGFIMQNTAYYKLARLSPNSSFSNGDSVRITGQLGNMSYDQLGTIDITVANRSHPTFAVSGSVIGNVLANSHDLLGCYNSDGSTDIYLKLKQGEYPTWNLNISATRSAIIYDNPSLTTTAPVPATGYSLVSLVFNSSVMWQGWTGNVGIGTTAPSGILDVNDSFVANKGSLYLRPEDNGSEGGQINLAAGGGKSVLWTMDNYDNRLRLFSDNTEDFTILSNGNVGMGTTTPAERLDLGGGNIKMGYSTNGNSHITVAASQAAQSWSGYVTVCSGNGFVISASCWAGYPYMTCPWSVNSSGQLAAFNCNGSGAANLSCNVICANIR
jgi:hypothetical protein